MHPEDVEAGCFVVCPEDGLRRSFGSMHLVAHAACVEHNRLHHPEPRGRSPKLLSVVYQSFSRMEITATTIGELLGQARSSNTAFGVTGMLLVEEGQFLQVLEGPELVVRGLMGSIQRDPRHQHIRILAQEVIRERRFPDWAMALGQIGDIDALPLAQYYEALLLTRGRPLP